MSSIEAVLAFPDPPIMRPLGGGHWQMVSDYTVPAFGFSMRIPEGFVTDLASVPRPFRILIGRDELGGAAPAAHDLLYQQGGYASGLVDPLRRVRVDRLFRALMLLERVTGWRRWCAWGAVRLAGWACWKKSDERIVRLQEKG